MADATLKGIAKYLGVNRYSDGVEGYAKISPRGEMVVLDFYTASIMEQRGFQLRGGIGVTPIVGVATLADTTCEAAVNAQNGMTIIPVHFDIMIETFNGTALTRGFLRSNDAVCSGGTAATLRNLYKGGVASLVTALMNDAGGVTAPADTVATGCMHLGLSSSPSADGTAVLAPYILDWQPTVPPVLNGAASIFFQIGATTTGPDYYFALDVIEYRTAEINPSL